MHAGSHESPPDGGASRSSCSAGIANVVYDPGHEKHYRYGEDQYDDDVADHGVTPTSLSFGSPDARRIARIASRRALTSSVVRLSNSPGFPRSERSTNILISLPSSS